MRDPEIAPGCISIPHHPAMFSRCSCWGLQFGDSCPFIHLSDCSIKGSFQILLMACTSQGIWRFQGDLCLSCANRLKNSFSSPVDREQMPWQDRNPQKMCLVTTCQFILLGFQKSSPKQNISTIGLTLLKRKARELRNLLDMCFTSWQNAQVTGIASTPIKQPQKRKYVIVIEQAPQPFVLPSYWNILAIKQLPWSPYSLSTAPLLPM